MAPAHRERLNGHTTAHATPPVTFAGLKSEISNVHRQLKELASERDTLALPALRGDHGAQTRIQEIDSERLAAAAYKETLEAALRSLHAEQRDSGWRQHLPRLRKALRIALGERWRHSVFDLERCMLGRQSHDIINLRQAVGRLDQLEQTVARETADSLLPQIELVMYTAGDQDDLVRARKEQQRRKEARSRQVVEAAQVLLDDAAQLQRPPVLDQALTQARKRLEATT